MVESSSQWRAKVQNTSCDHGESLTINKWHKSRHHAERMVSQVNSPGQTLNQIVAAGVYETCCVKKTTNNRAPNFPPCPSNCGWSCLHLLVPRRIRHTPESQSNQQLGHHQEIKPPQGQYAELLHVRTPPSAFYALVAPKRMADSRGFGVVMLDGLGDLRMTLSRTCAQDAYPAPSP